MSLNVEQTGAERTRSGVGRSSRFTELVGVPARRAA
jgi:hypothetical protein